MTLEYAVESQKVEELVKMKSCLNVVSSFHF
jgi:hypothetical protein